MGIEVLRNTVKQERAALEKALEEKQKHIKEGFPIYSRIKDRYEGLNVLLSNALEYAQRQEERVKELEDAPPVVVRRNTYQVGSTLGDAVLSCSLDQITRVFDIPQDDYNGLTPEATKALKDQLLKALHSCNLAIRKRAKAEADQTVITCEYCYSRQATHTVKFKHPGCNKLLCWHCIPPFDVWVVRNVAQVESLKK
jgi:hypothetical protein